MDNREGCASVYGEGRAKIGTSPTSGSGWERLLIARPLSLQKKEHSWEMLAFFFHMVVVVFLFLPSLGSYVSFTSMRFHPFLCSFVQNEKLCSEIEDLNTSLAEATQKIQMRKFKVRQ